jgi:hypothetical protein
MRAGRSALGWTLAMCVGAVAALDAQIQTAPSSIEDEASVSTVTEEIEEIVIRGRRIGDLRAETRRAEEALFARFNEINSTDDFDIHCRREKFYNWMQRLCMSNVARRTSANIAGAQVSGNLSGMFLYRHQLRRAQNQLIAEMQRLTAEDEQLRQANAGLAEARYALMLVEGIQTMSRQAPPTLELPYGAKLMFEVIIGTDPWKHPLTERTFTLANVSGELRRIKVECAEGSQRIDYELGIEWAVPSSWDSCVLQVNAKRDTSFRLYEF